MKRPLIILDTDIVMVDTGNSYEGLCEYVGGKYISYTEEHPITMNPFRITRAEFNIEKVGFLKNLVMLIWKGTNGTVRDDGRPGRVRQVRRRGLFLGSRSSCQGA